VNIEIRQEKTSDYTDVFILNKNVFGRENEAMLVNALRDSDAFTPELSLVAIHNSKIVGHILFTKVVIKNERSRSVQSLSLAPMAVDQALQNQGIGSLLVNYGLEKAGELGYRSVIVLGHDYYYPRFGFRPASQWGIKAPFDVPDNVFMALELVKNSLEGINGTVKYPEEFESV